VTVLLNGSTGKPVDVPDALVDRFRAAGFTDPAPEPDPKPVRKSTRATRTDDVK
jgi:hypothetical protein